MDVLGPHVLVRADPNTYAIAAIATWLAASGRCGREGSRPMTDFSSPRRTDQPAKRSTTWRVPLNSNGRWLAANVRVQPGLRDQSEAVDRTAHAKRAAIDHVRVHHRRADVRVAQQLLHGPNVVPILEQVWANECRPRSPRLRTGCRACSSSFRTDTSATRQRASGTAAC